ncbi:hypothetical protein BKA65DRAFT_489543 [Rhexocercosporidium sp. MPI-PUGE-AT-0058]|nr:hypothetical protein BKA65DRAFT_489543 [Rhexocercosporidium sp. MPI-PUGE-AT-0058]
MRNTQNLALTPFAAMQPNMLQIAHLQQPVQPQRMNLFTPPFAPTIFPSPMISGVTPGAMYPNVGFPNIMAQPHCLHQQQPHCHHQESENHCGHHRGRHGCSSSRGHSSLDSPFNRGSRSRSRSRTRSHSRRRSRSRSPPFRSQRVQILGGSSRDNAFYSSSSSSIYLPFHGTPHYHHLPRPATIKISLSASIGDIRRCLVRSDQEVGICLMNGLELPLSEFSSVEDLRRYDQQINFLFVFER